MSPRIVFAPLIALMLLGAGFSAWMTAGGPAIERDPSALPRSVTMDVGDRLVLDDGSALRFVGLVEDSRCPMDAMCIWQGQAVLAFEIDGRPFQVTYLTPGDAGTVSAGSAGFYRVVIEDVQPYPM
ncbi:MAG: hypothetical protein WD800_02100, partial [Dehalococcoidia bacterium]